MQAGDGHDKHEAEGWTTRLYRRVMNPLILECPPPLDVSRGRGCAVARGSCVRAVEMGAGEDAPLRQQERIPSHRRYARRNSAGANHPRVAQALGGYLGQQPEVTNYQIYAGTSGPYNFNGLVRHYFLRRQPNQADIQVNLLSRHDRKAQSHEIARRLRPELDKIAEPFGARIKVAEVPPGPPVLQTLVAEVYGPDYKSQIELALQIKKIFQQTAGVVDVDWYVEDPQTKYDLKVDLDKAALHGISSADVTRTLQVGLSGANAGLLHDPNSREDVPIEVRLARSDRSGIENLESLKLPTLSGRPDCAAGSHRSSADHD